MCRDRNTGQRRCPCDTSEARRLRRQNSAAKGSYAVLATEPVESKALPIVTPAEPFTAESVKADIDALSSLASELRASGASSSEVLAAYDSKINAIGAGVEYLAEEKYGAPKDEELKDSVEQASLRAEKEADERKVAAYNVIHSLEADEERLRGVLNVYADSTTHPILKERHAVWAEKDPETYADWKSKDTEAREAYKSITGRYDQIRESIDAVRRPLLEKRNEAMQQALRDVGVEFADPETVKFSEDSHTDAVKSLKNALGYFPQSWVDASNAQQQNRELRIKRSKGRAHYSSSRGQNSFTTKTVAFIVQKPKDWEPDPHDRHGSEYISLEGASEWVDPRSGVVHENWYYAHKEGVRGWVSVSYTYHKGNDVPKGNWEKVEHYEEEYVSGQGMVRTGNMVTRYRKPKLRRGRASLTYKAELTVSKDGYAMVGKDEGMRVAMHEFSHRVEHTTPIVTAYEDAFLKRRAGHLPSPDGSHVEPEKLTSIYSGKTEMGFKDNFPSHYMGKVYNDDYREILSMGMESLFAGTNGGLAGMGNHKADPDYKKFILGVLASSAKK